MLNIEIVGTESTHTPAYTEILNSGTAARVTKIVDTDDYKKITHADAVIITERNGNLHAPVAEYFLNLGIPLFIDKPFACNVQDALRITQCAQKNNVILMGGSTIKLVEDVQAFKGVKDALSAKLSFVADTGCEYNGLHFYGSHLAEMAIELFGADYRLVSARVENGEVKAGLKYGGFTVELYFSKTQCKPLIQVETKNGLIEKEADISSCNKCGMEKFIKILTGKEKPEPAEKFISNVKLMEDIVQTINK